MDMDTNTTRANIIIHRLFLLCVGNFITKKISNKKFKEFQIILLGAKMFQLRKEVEEAIGTAVLNINEDVNQFQLRFEKLETSLEETKEENGKLKVELIKRQAHEQAFDLNIKD